MPKKALSKSTKGRAAKLAPAGSRNGKAIETRQPTSSQVRSYREVSAVGRDFDDWALNALSIDSETWQFGWTLRQRSRDLWRTNPYFVSYADDIRANVFGDRGILLNSRVKETEDRVVHAPDEKAFLEARNLRRQKILNYVATKTGDQVRSTLKECERQLADYRRGTAKVQVGELDVYANNLIETNWRDWQRAKYCDIRKQRDYNTLRQLRLINCAQDGDHFIRMIRTPRVNEWGFSIQLINSEWCDWFYNEGYGDTGREIRMGIEYERNDWGISEPIRYYFIRRQPNDWQWTIPGAFNFSSGALHDVVDARDILHYARLCDNDSTRPAPWCAPIIPKARQLDAFELAEVIAARVAACKMGWLQSSVVPEGGYMDAPPDPTKCNNQNFTANPGSFQGLPFGVEFKEWDPKHPSQNFENFRKGMLRSLSAGLPGSNYASMANDYESINFSAGRLDRLSYTEDWRLLQRFDIETAERPIFEAWLEMSLATGKIPLPLSKFKKFNQPHFQGRRWEGVQPMEETQAALLRIANCLTSRTKTVAEQDGRDFEELLEEIVTEQMLMEEYGLSSIVTNLTSSVQAAQQHENDEQSTEASGDGGEGRKPAGQPGAGQFAGNGGGGKKKRLAKPD